MTQRGAISALALCVALAACDRRSGALRLPDRGHRRPNARLLASGIPGAGAIVQVQPFLPGSPIHDSPTLNPAIAPGAILDGKRVLVTSTSSFGAPPGRADQYPGSVLSLDLSRGPLVVPPGFAAAGGQASALDGAVRLYAANGASFFNRQTAPSAVTADEVSASLPLGISINNGTGRPWLANAPGGAHADGTITVLDPDGAPLANPPNPRYGGVFKGALSNHPKGATHALGRGAVGTAIFTRSVDGSGRAVFAAAMADGAVAQVHVQKGVSDLAPPGSFTALPRVTPADAESNDPRVYSRVGMAFNWAPTFNIFVADPAANRLLVLDIADDGAVFTARSRYLTSEAFDGPVDVAPTTPEVAAGNFASGTSLSAGSDLYVLCRGPNTVVRIRPDGRVVAVEQVRPDADIPGFRVAGLGVSPDGQTIWIAATGDAGTGYVLAMASFGESVITRELVAAARPATSMEDIGESIFRREFGVSERVGPLFNDRSCGGCHAGGGMGAVATPGVRVARIEGGRFDPLVGKGGPIVRRRSIAELGVDCSLRTGVPPGANAVSPRSAMTLHGTGLIDSIQDKDIVAAMNAEPEAIRGHQNRRPDGRLGRFGWKAEQATLVECMGDAFLGEMGLTNPIEPDDLVVGCGAALVRPELDGLPLSAVSAYMNRLNPPAPPPACLASPGASLFAQVGCAGCHTPTLPSQGQKAQLYSDLLLHDMGPGLADGFPAFQASGSEFRTMPLWRVSERAFFLHDARATTIEAAIRAHGGQAAAAEAAFAALAIVDRQALIDFLGCI